MKLKFWVLYLLPSLAFSFPCYLTLVKDNCWTNFNVTYNVVDAETLKSINTTTVPKGQSWMRQQFNCTAGQKITYSAYYSPKIWDDEKPNQLYQAKRVWGLPDQIKDKQSAWEITICFAEQFSAVPVSPNQVDKCACDFASIPAIPEVIRYQ